MVGVSVSSKGSDAAGGRIPNFYPLFLSQGHPPLTLTPTLFSVQERC
jgi:hypothetical protein